MFYRLRKSISYSYFQYRTRNVLTSPPSRCNPSGACEVHTMLSSTDLPPYLVAVKSLLRFYDGMAIVILSDGSLNGGHVRLLQEHVPGCRIIDASEADLRAAQVLAGNPFMEK